MPTLNRPGGSASADPRTEPIRQPTRGDRPPPPPPARPRGRPATSKRRRFSWLTYLLLLWLVFLVAVPAWAWTQITKVDAEPDAARPEDQPGSTYLLVGSDSREELSAEERQELGTGQAEGRRTDTIMLLHTGDGPNLLLSIPRDSIVDIPGVGSDQKVNAAYALGGPELLVQTLEEETGIRIDNYVEIGFGGFVSVIDAVGGIEICPRQPIEDPKAKLNIDKGCQEADGPTALGYARTRQSSLGDIDRARRQREVVSSVGSKAISPWSVLNPVRYVRLASASADALAVGEDTGPIDTARFAFAMTRVDGENGLTCSVPIVDLAVTWDRERALQLFELIREDRTAEIPDELCRPSGLAGQ
ncbi:MAG: Cell envelope-associated transcriptional attenuator LytR-CpsA-Psr, subfamily A1 [uncultured Nocardioidaceae bacterium]|uniref:Cell envelope-associated transcriptional attenuator LytR-CpsA-Psr, subfamily A1 n=1 Tax=uncultured Nocardioidaceae bacterium TaxID=253824 RepID=A0A6J4LIL0_9ACTN|nr:MAG: Cell envelope-associated transcriptional attenuator LytR-CpsA-Psr, subfamily A1 [uncultured Nocardioidaceae bacterium]